MQIQIKTKNFIPVEIGELSFQLSLADENLERIMNSFNTMYEKMDKVDKSSLMAVKEIYIEALDLLLGEGAGNKIYRTYPSVLTLNEITTQLSLEVKEKLHDSLKASTQTEVMQSYLQKKNK